MCQQQAASSAYEADRYLLYPPYGLDCYTLTLPLCLWILEVFSGQYSIQPWGDQTAASYGKSFRYP